MNGDLVHKKTDEIEKNSKDEAYAIFRLLSRNETKGTHRATEEELLQELLDELKLALQKDLDRAKNPLTEGEDDGHSGDSYPTFFSLRKAKANRYRQESSGFRKLACLPTVMLALVMASRIRHHYVHAPWFRVGTLNKMAEVHGAV